MFGKKSLGTFASMTRDKKRRDERIAKLFLGVIKKV
jgi:hypothetical protein